METRGAGPRLVWLRQDYGAGLIQDGVHVKLGVNRARDGTYNHHGVMLKVELESGRLHSVLIERLRRKRSESRSLFSEKSEGHVIWTGAQWSDGSVKLVIGR